MRRTTVLLAVTLALFLLVAVATAAASESNRNESFRIDTISVTVSRVAEDLLDVSYTGSDGEDCGYWGLYISAPAKGIPGQPIAWIPTTPMDRSSLLDALDEGVWVAFQTLRCGTNAGDYGSRGFAGQIRTLDVGESFTVKAATFG